MEKSRIGKSSTKKVQVCVIGNVTSPYRCNVCGYFFVLYAQTPSIKPKKCPRCHQRSPLGNKTLR